MGKHLENILRFYIMATQLKYKIRSGWDNLHWDISSQRRESIAEHIYSACILAIAMDSEFNTGLDIYKVIIMLVLHELGEVKIGDITPFDDITREEKTKMEHEAMKCVLGDLLKADEYYDLLVEFDERKTKESIFAYHCDKLDADLQAKIYQDMGCQKPLDKQENNIVFKNAHVQRMLEEGAESAFDIWYQWDRSLYSDDENFSNLLDYIKGIDTQNFNT